MIPNFQRCSKDRKKEVGRKFKCPPAMPFVVKNSSPTKDDKCAGSPPANCPDLLEFECTSAGMFAMASSINSFIVCKENTNATTAATKPFIHRLFNCASDEKYNPKNKLSYCDKQVPADKDFKPVSCKNMVNGTIIRLRNLNDYVVCDEEKLFNYACPDTTQFDASLAPIPCSFVCSKNGKFPHEYDADKYYDCRCIGPGCHKIETCKEGYTFNASTSQCSFDIDLFGFRMRSRMTIGLLSETEPEPEPNPNPNFGRN